MVKSNLRGPVRRSRAQPKGRREILESLNAPQREAVRFGDGPLLVVAGPGSGKTRVIAHRIAYLLARRVPPSRLLALTFTNKAAAEMARRVEELAGKDATGVWTSTFHSFCARVLRIEASAIGLSRDFVIYDADDSDRVVRAILKESKLKLDGLMSKADLRARISLLKNELIPAAKVRARDAADRLIKKVYGSYQKRLGAANALDFDDLLARAVELFERDAKVLRKYADRFLYILVDEYQDTNGAQARLLGLLARKHRNVCVTGDPDQSIYGWRGATVRNILDFPGQFSGAKVVRLEQGYRSTRRILEAADGVIEKNTERFDRVLWTENPVGAPVHIILLRDREAEAAQIAAEITSLRRGGKRYRDFAVLYRLNSYSRTLEQELVKRRIPYQIVGGIGFYQRREIKDVLAYLRLVVNSADDLSFERIVNVPRRGVGAKALASLQAAARATRTSLLEVVRRGSWQGKIRRASGLAALGELYDQLGEMPLRPVAALVDRVLESTGYLKGLEAEGEEERLQNIEELVDAARAYDRENPEGDLSGFLERVSLVTDVDRWNDQEDRVRLMTLHMAKGLEFPVVFMAGMDEGLVPFIRRTESWWEEPEIDPEQLEEERRLCFVGITRARELLVFTHAEETNWDYAEPSRFLEDLPEGVLKLCDRSRASRVTSVIKLGGAGRTPARRRSTPARR